MISDYTYYNMTQRKFIMFNGLCLLDRECQREITINLFGKETLPMVML